MAFNFLIRYLGIISEKSHLSSTNRALPAQLSILYSWLGYTSRFSSAYPVLGLALPSLGCRQKSYWIENICSHILDPEACILQYPSNQLLVFACVGHPVAVVVHTMIIQQHFVLPITDVKNSYCLQFTTIRSGHPWATRHRSVNGLDDFLKINLMSPNLFYL